MGQNRQVTSQQPPTPAGRRAAPVAPSADVLPQPRLPRSGFLQQGYAVAQVDRFLAELRRVVGDRPPAMTVHEVLEQEFDVRRLRRGYRLRAVDDYLDEAAEALGRCGAPLGEPSGPPAPVRTGWIYATAAVLVALIVAFAVLLLFL